MEFRDFPDFCDTGADFLGLGGLYEFPVGAVVQGVDSAIRAAALLYRDQGQVVEPFDPSFDRASADVELSGDAEVPESASVGST